MEAILTYPVPTPAPVDYKREVTQWEQRADDAIVLDAYCAGEYRINHQCVRFLTTVSDRLNRPIPLTRVLEADRGDEETTFFLLDPYLLFPVRIALIPA